ncbi:MAG: ferritin family protein [Candidatus Aadella gelida]|nr:ferritin family protein [Candidatus Aadella gelida]
MPNNFSGCEIVELAMQIEKNGKEFYNTLNEEWSSPAIGGIFEYLAGQEEKHIEMFSKIFDGVCGHDPEEAYPEEYDAYMRALAGQYVFTEKNKGEMIAKGVKSLEEGIDLAIGFEKDSILFYEEVKKNVPEISANLVEDIISEEKIHLEKLCAHKGGCEL